MRKLFILPIYFLLLINFSVMAQTEPEPKTLFKSGRATGFGQFDVKYTQIRDNDVLILGGQGGVILNRHVILGLTAHSTVNDLYFDGTAPAERLSFQMGYGGILLGYIVAPVKVVHISFPVSFGAGTVNIYNRINESFYGETIKVDIENSLFLYTEPGIQLELNIVKFMKIAAGVSYRLNHSLDLTNPIKSNDLNNWATNFSIVLGKF